MDKLLNVQYLSFDSLQEGVGASQTLPYVMKLSDETRIKLVNFEKDSIPFDLKSQIEYRSLDWQPMPYGRFGALGGMFRIFRLATKIDRRSIIHARGDFSALSAILGGGKNIIWDCRAFTPDQRIAAKGKRKLSFEYFGLRLVELICAKFSAHIIVITNKAKLELIKRYEVKEAKITCISTCVNLEKFVVKNTAKENRETMSILFAGSLGPQYDFKLMNSIVLRLKELTKVFFCIAAPYVSDEVKRSLSPDSVISVNHSQMPQLISNFDIGLSIWRENMGISLKSVSATKNAEFLACGKPIVVNCNQGDIGDIVKKFGVGVVTTDSDTQSIDAYAKEILSLMEHKVTLSSICRQVAEMHYSLDEGVKNLKSVYKQINCKARF